MLITLSIWLLFSNASTLKKDKSILYSRIVMKELILGSIITFTSLYTILSGSSIEICINKCCYIKKFTIFIYGFPTVVPLFTQTCLVKIYKKKQIISFNPENIIANGSFSSAISIITLIIILFVYMPEQWFNIVSILHKQWKSIC